MRHFIFAIFTTLLCSTAFGQDLGIDQIAEEVLEIQENRWTIGPRVGLGFSTTPQETAMIYLAQDAVAYEITYLGNTSSKSIGITFEKEFDYAFIQFGLNHMSSGATFDVNGYGEKDKTKEIFNETYRNLEIPVLAGGKFKIFRLGAGPVFTANLNTTTDFANLLGYKLKNSQLNFGSQAAFGIDLGIFNIDIRYVKSFEAVGERMSFGDNNEDNFKNRPSEIKVTIGTSF